MKTFQLTYQQLQTKTIVAESLEEAGQVARAFAKANPSVKLLELVGYDLNTYVPPNVEEPA